VSIVLPVEGPAHLDPGDLGHGIGRVGGLQRPGKEILLFQRLRGQAGIDAGTAEKKKFFHPQIAGRPDNMVLDHQVFIDKLGRPAVIGVNPPDPGGGQENILRPLPTEEIINRRLVQQIEFPARTQQQVVIPGGFQTPDNRRTDQSPVTGHIDFSTFIHNSFIRLKISAPETASHLLRQRHQPSCKTPGSFRANHT